MGRAAVAACLAVAGLAACTVPAPPVPKPAPAPAPWTVPTRPPACTAEQIAAAKVAGCVLLGPGVSPPARGWPTPPFPATSDGAPIAWTTMSTGSSGHNVVKVQVAVSAATGTSLVPDGEYGSLTAAAVKQYQTSKGLKATGAVDAATAAALRVTATAPGPFPPSGWTWLGWAYNGSANLRGWESGLTTNRTAIGPIKAGWLRGNPAVMPLFEGFLKDVVTRGYQLRNWGVYAFRCMSTTRKDCFERTPYDLSNHGYGLALDINTAENPALYYNAPTGGTACSVAMRTDMPRWVVQTAERWGLYWLGYGPCATPADVRSRAYRDPMHFEFRGTPQQARAIAAANGVSAAEAAPVVVVPREPPPPPPEVHEHA